MKVSGTAAGGTTVLLDGGCGGCTALALADTDGRWTATLKLRGGRTTISAATADSAKPLDAVDVRVRAPAAPAPIAVPDDTPEPVPTAAPAPDRVVLIGDSLAVGIEGLLGADASDALTGRTLAQGMSIIDATDLTSTPTVLAVSLFTNDGPTSVAQLQTAVERSIRAVGDGGCVVWATIARPPVGGVSYADANRALRALEARYGPKLVVVPWAETVAAQPSLLAPDGVHGTPAGYQARAQLYREAIASCSP